MPAHTRRVPCSTQGPYVSDADWCLCSDGGPDSRLQTPTLPPRNKRPPAGTGGSTFNVNLVSAMHDVTPVAALEGHASRDGYLVMDADGKGAVDGETGGAGDEEAAAIGEAESSGAEAIYMLPNHTAGHNQGHADPIYATITSPDGQSAGSGACASLLAPSRDGTVSRVVQREDHEVVVVDGGGTDLASTPSRHGNFRI